MVLSLGDTSFFAEWPTVTWPVPLVVRLPVLPEAAAAVGGLAGGLPVGAAVAPGAERKLASTAAEAINMKMPLLRNGDCTVSQLLLIDVAESRALFRARM